ncbi:uncharacterized protein MELLADRAFT_90132 [Melampsora larici-populina 98AG31]|uniref:RRM domain-containing protein n=1 Tax=Melampsora larici-populina (strain 98AG31 / pathotype 3-4-7) TaxID=747676 RepID=F4RVT1_MELLP|nr:uncharacterized protein MELLADRAFT_90132 [Melampsora larici-populina 98AG31]EGG03413.1 hypothetical protein MELLADRAFT_90132 [Melampsora larici-populina 98AG31]
MTLTLTNSVLKCFTCFFTSYIPHKHYITLAFLSSSAIASLNETPPSPTNVFLANFPKSWNEFDLAQLFIGIPILTVHVIRDKLGPCPGPGVSRGVGFVNVLHNHHAVTLVRYLDRKIWLDGDAPLKIRLAKATAPQSSKKRLDLESAPLKPMTENRGHGSQYPSINLLKELTLAAAAVEVPIKTSPTFMMPRPLPHPPAHPYGPVNIPLPFQNPKAWTWPVYQLNEVPSIKHHPIPSTFQTEHNVNTSFSISPSVLDTANDFITSAKTHSTDSESLDTSSSMEQKQQFNPANEFESMFPALNLSGLPPYNLFDPFRTDVTSHEIHSPPIKQPASLPSNLLGAQFRKFDPFSSPPSRYFTGSPPSPFALEHSPTNSDHDPPNQSKLNFCVYGHVGGPAIDPKTGKIIIPRRFQALYPGAKKSLSYPI